MLRNTLSTKWPKRVKCKGCRSRLEINLEDLSYGEWTVSGYHFAGTAKDEGKYTFRCPVCGLEANGNEVSEDELPAEARRVLRARYEGEDETGADAGGLGADAGEVPDPDPSQRPAVAEEMERQRNHFAEERDVVMDFLRERGLLADFRAWRSDKNTG